MNYEYEPLSYTTNTEVSSAALGAFLAIYVIAILAVYVFMGICLMKVFKKAGRTDAWAAWVPIYNNYVMYEVAGRPGWWVFLSFIPFVGWAAAIVTSIIASIDLAKSFGKDTGFAILLILLPIIGYPMLAFGDAQYKGPAGPEGHKPAAA